MLKILRTNSDNHDFIGLVKLLDIDLATRDGNDYSFYAQFNKIDKLKFVVVAYENEQPVGCGAIKRYDWRMRRKPLSNWKKKLIID